MFLNAFKIARVTFIVMAAAAAHAQRHALSSDVDHYSSPSVRLSADTSNAGSNARNVLIENDYEVTYGTYFKIVRMKCGFHHAVNNPSRCTKITYVLRKRGTAIPTTDPHTNESIETTNEDGVQTRHFEIPATSIAVGGGFVLAYLEMLDVNTDTLKLIDSRYMHSPCMQLAVHTGDIVDQATAVYDANWNMDTSAWSAKCDELNVDLAFTDEFGTGKCDNREDANVMFHGNADNTAILRAEWVKFVSLFFDKEQFANEYFALESDAVEAIKNYVEKGIVASLAEKKTCVWVQKSFDGQYYEILHDVYRTSLCTDAGMNAYEGEEGASKKAFAIDTQLEQFHSTIRDYDVVVDESYFYDVSSKNETDYENNLAFDQLSGQTVKAKTGNGGLLLRVDASRGNAMTDDLKESGEVRPALLLNDFVSNVYGGTLSNHDSCPKYFRRADEPEIYVTHENCAALEAADNEKKCVRDLKEEAERLTPSSSVLDSSAVAMRGTMLARIGVSIATTMVVLLAIA
jgi:iron complex transport system substrate-binding protein